MSKIKVYVRVRPPLPGEFDQPGCFNCTEMEDVSGNWIQVKKEGEPKRYFARVWGPGSSQDEMFRTIGINTVCDVLEGFYGCIFVYGQTGTGKTFTLGCLTPGLEGIQPQCLRFLFEKVQKESGKYEVLIQQQYVQLYRDAVQDLIDITKDNLKVRVDEANGAVIEKVTTRTVTTYEESIDMIREGDGNRVVANTKMNSASSRSHACCIVEVTRKERSTGKQTFGRLYLIDLAGSERVSKSGVTDEAFKEAVAINKSLTTLGNCIAAIVNKEKTVSFRDSPLTRILQHSLTGHGRTSIIITIRPDSPNMQETLCTIRFGERAQKVEAQMTPASYLEQLLEGIGKAVSIERTLADASLTSIQCQRWAGDIKLSIVSKEDEAKEKERESVDMIDQLKRRIESAASDFDAQFDTIKKSKEADTHSQVDELRKQNASVIEEIDKKVAEAEATARDKMAIQMKPVLSELDTFRKEEGRLAGELEAARSEAARYVDPSARVQSLMAELDEKIKVVQRKIKGCRPSKNDGMSLFDLRTKESMLRDAIAKMEIRKVGIVERKLQGWDQAKMVRMFKRPDREETLTYLEAASEMDPYNNLLEEQLQEADAPPSDTASESSTQTSSYDSDSSDSDSSDDSDSYSDDSDADSAAREEIERLQQGLTRLDGKPLPNIPAERAQLDLSMEKDSQLGVMLNDIVRFVDMGSFVYMVDPPLQKGGVPIITKRYMFLHGCESELATMRSEPRDTGLAHLPHDERLPAQPSLCISSPLNPKMTDIVDRRDVDVAIKLRDIGRVIMGQYSRTWLDSIEGAPMLPPGTETPKDCSRISPTTLPAFLSRSISLMSTGSEHNVLADLVFNEEVDMESWLITLHRLLRKEPQFGRLMDLTGHEGVDDLNDNERAYCSLNHMPPQRFSDIKQTVLRNRDPKNLFFTMLDLRNISGLDILQTQRLFEFFYLEGLFERVTSFYIRYAESVQAEDEELERQRVVRDIRVRIIAMLRYYRQLSIDATQSILLECVGKEDNLLQMLIAQYGSEPPSEEEAAERESRRHYRAQILALLRYFCPELGTHACRQRIIEISIEQSEEAVLKDLMKTHKVRFIPTEEMILAVERNYLMKMTSQIVKDEVEARIEFEKMYTNAVGELSALIAQGVAEAEAASNSKITGGDKVHSDSQPSAATVVKAEAQVDVAQAASVPAEEASCVVELPLIPDPSVAVADLPSSDGAPNQPAEEEEAGGEEEEYEEYYDEEYQEEAEEAEEAEETPEDG